ncbi:ROK family protein [Proteinivorax tanatarense]|uniref:ROK family protein n=1 Tax=Proteinivorax tanatarense TaxID=1260629 RepID=A0AAU7VKC6_9FIRM
MKNYMAFDLGGTNLKYGVVNQHGEIVDKGITPTPRKDIKDLIDLMGKLTKDFAAKYKIESVALSCPGTVDNKEGVIRGTSAIPYIHGPNIKEILGAKTKLKVYMENDANCAALAELWQGVARECKDVLFIICGTGIGGAVIKNKQLHVGQNLHGGEFGYMLAEKDFKKGKFKNWSEVASTNALIENVAQRKQIKSCQLDGVEVFKLAAKNDKECLEAIDEWYMQLAVGIYNLQYIYDPEMIIVGGAISARDDLDKQISQRLKTILDKLGYAEVMPNVKRCALKNDANLIGAVYGALNC